MAILNEQFRRMQELAGLNEGNNDIIEVLL